MKEYKILINSRDPVNDLVIPEISREDENTGKSETLVRMLHWLRFIGHPGISSRKQSQGGQSDTVTSDVTVNGRGCLNDVLKLLLANPIL